MAQLQTMVQQKDGIAMKKGQVYNALKEKTGTLCSHLASYRMLHGWIAYMTKKDPGGTYVIEADWLDGNAHFSYLFAAPSATKKVQGYHIVSLPTDDPFAYVSHTKYPRGYIFVLDYGHLGDVPPGYILSITTFLQLSLALGRCAPGGTCSTFTNCSIHSCHERSVTIDISKQMLCLFQRYTFPTTPLLDCTRFTRTLKRLAR